MHYVEHGRGVPVVALHGVGVDHREIEAAIEAIVPGTGYRRIYPDSRGMGRSTTEGLTSNNDVVSLLGDLIETWSPPCWSSGWIGRLTQQLKPTHGPGFDLVRGTPGSCGGRNTPSPEVLSMRFSYCMVPEVYQLFWAAMARVHRCRCRGWHVSQAGHPMVGGGGWGSAVPRSWLEGSLFDVAAAGGDRPRPRPG